ncbi:MAG TPA: DUF3558 family protein [Micromonosporaceae bacterium]|jgi:hypothetical protein
MRLKSLIIAIVAMTALGLAGCAKDSTTNPTTNPTANLTAGPSGNPSNSGVPGGGGAAPDPCTLLTTDEATAVLGEKAKDGEPHSSTGTKQCEWDAVSGHSSVAILIWVGGWSSKWQSTHDSSKAAPGFKDVSGLGDAAFSNGIDLHILKGDDMYQIGVLGPFKDLVAKATTVAQKALARA